MVGEELGVLPGMDPIFSILALGRLLGFLRNTSQQSSQQDKFDIIILDGMSSEEVIRMIGASSKARLRSPHHVISFLLCFLTPSPPVDSLKNEKEKENNAQVDLLFIFVCRLYLKYLRRLVEKTDLGRLAGPSLLRLSDEAMGISSGGASLNGKLSSEIWDRLEQILEVCKFI